MSDSRYPLIMSRRSAAELIGSNVFAAMRNKLTTRYAGARQNVQRATPFGRRSDHATLVNRQTIVPNDRTVTPSRILPRA